MSKHRSVRRDDEPNRRRFDERTGRSELATAVGMLWIAPAIAIAAAVLLTVSNPAALIDAAPILALWFVSPGVAWWISRPFARRDVRLTIDQVLFLKKLARRTWAFFEAFVGPDDQWLPPDNFQEHPVVAIAHPNIVDRYVSNLRGKLGDPPLISTVRGTGFMLGR